MTAQAIDRPARSWWDSFLAFLGSLSERSDLSRRAKVAERLYAMSDAELAEIGLTRAQVLHHAFGSSLRV
jgi:hypothetical protein